MLANTHWISSAVLFTLLGISEAFTGARITSLSLVTWPQPNSCSLRQDLPLKSTGDAQRFLSMVATKPQIKKNVEKGTDPEKLKLGRYELFPADKSKMNLDLDLNAFKFEGGRDLRRLYHSSGRIVVAEYYMAKCPTCKIMRELMHPMMKKLRGSVQFVEVEVLKDQDVIRQAGLFSVPAVQVFKEGQIIDHFSGLQTATKLRQRFRALLQQHPSQDIC